MTSFYNFLQMELRHKQPIQHLTYSYQRPYIIFYVKMIFLDFFCKCIDVWRLCDT